MTGEHLSSTPSPDPRWNSLSSASSWPDTTNPEPSNSPEHSSTPEDKSRLSDKEILESETAQNILPYLTLDHLSDHEKAETLELSDKVLDALRDKSLTIDNPSLCYDLLNYAMAKIANEGELKYTDEILAAIMKRDSNMNISGEMFQDFLTYDRQQITPKRSQVQKLFLATLFNAANDSGDPDTQLDLYKTFFSSSPNFSSYHGDFKDTLELLTISERGGRNLCSESMIRETIYNHSFTDYNAFKQVMDDSSPIEQLRLMPVYRTLAMHSTDDYSLPALNKIISTLGDLSDNPSCTPLVRVASESFLCDISDDLNLDLWQYRSDPMDPTTMDYQAIRRSLEQAPNQNQEQLHEIFHNLPINKSIVPIAPGVAGTLDSNGQIDLISDKSGNQTSLLDYNKDNPFAIDRDSSFLIRVAHNPTTQALIESNLGGIELNRLSLEAQSSLVKYMAESDDKRIMRLCNTMNILMYENENLAYKLAENFLATSFGKDFGDALLEIAESLQDNFSLLSGGEVEKIFDQISSCRESIKGITGLYKPIYKGEFAKQYARASNERLTDVIAAFREIAKKGEVSDELKWGRDNIESVSFDYDSAMEALEYETNSLAIISGTMQDVLKGTEGCFAERLVSPNHSGEDLSHAYSYYDFYSPNYGYVSLHTRAIASSAFSSDIEYSGEASISLMADPINPFIPPKPHPPKRKYEIFEDPKTGKFKHGKEIIDFYDESTMNRVSAIRLDREGRTQDMSAGDPKKSSIADRGVVSVDLAGIKDRSDTPSGKIARLVGLGNKLRLGEESTINHNISGFSHDKFGTAEGFRGIVEYVDSLMMGLCNEFPPAKGLGAREQRIDSRLSEIDKQLQKLEQKEKSTAEGLTEEDMRTRRNLKKEQRDLEAAKKIIKRERGRRAVNRFNRAA